MAIDNPSRGASQGATTPILSLQNIHVHFGGIVALHDECFEVHPGEIIGLLGHNGAGKSTLVNVATGAVRPQGGSMLVEGRKVAALGNPRDIEHVGIKVIHQEPALAGNLSVADNISLGRPDEWQSPARRKVRAREALQLLGSSINVDRPVDSLEFGERQIVDLARALSTDLKVLFLDEPTGALGQHEADRLHTLLQSLAAQGRGIVYVSHRLRDILSVCSRLVVLRGGKVVLNQPAASFTVARLSEALAPGIRTGAQSSTVTTGQTLLRVRYGQQELQFCRGEIVGLFGMAAGPQFGMLEDLYGIGAPIEVGFDGQVYRPKDPRDAIRHGIYYVSANRERDGLLGQMSALDNLVLPWLDRHKSWLAYSRSKAARIFQKAQDSLNLRGGHMDGPVSALSGGNRQKVILGRWIFGDRPNVLLLAQPTQGVDVGARTDIARALRKLADDGVTVLVASSEADEIELTCDRAYTCYGDQWPETLPSAEWSEVLLKSLVERVPTKKESVQ